MTLSRKNPLRTSTPIAPVSRKRLAKLAAAGVSFLSSTFAPREPKTAQALWTKRAADTGPTGSTTNLLHRRSGRICEWPGCWSPATDRHHRLNRKSGGRHGVMRERLNGVAWLLHCCRLHHAYVTSPFGPRLARARAMGWLLLEGQDATQVPVLTRHDPLPVLLDDAGKWHRFEKGAA